MRKQQQHLSPINRAVPHLDALDASPDGDPPVCGTRELQAAQNSHARGAGLLTEISET